MQKLDKLLKLSFIIKLFFHSFNQAACFRYPEEKIENLFDCVGCLLWWKYWFLQEKRGKADEPAEFGEEAENCSEAFHDVHRDGHFEKERSRLAAVQIHC